MLTTILGFMRTPQMLVIASLVAGLGYFVYEYDSRGRQIEKLKRDKSVIANTLKVSKINVRLANKTIDELNAFAKKRDGELKDICKIYVKNEALDDNADAVGEALEGLKGLEKR